MNLTRRDFLLGSAAAVALAACGGGDDDDADASGGEGSGGWSFTDGLGETIELERRPERVVAQVGAAVALWDLGVRPVGVFGPQHLADGSPDPALGRLDLDQVTSVGEAYGEINLEALAELQPDLIVTASYGEPSESNPEGTYWYVVPEQADQVREIAPIAVVTVVGRPLDEVLDSWAEMGEALGADLEADDVVAARERFTAASDGLRAAVEEKAGLQALLVSGAEDGMYVSHPQSAPDAWYFTNLGLDIVTPEIDVSEFFELLSWERVDQYPADLLLYDARGQAYTRDQLMAEPTFAALPAAEAGQLAPWRVEAPYSHLTYAQVLEELTTAVRDADPDIVP